MRLISYSDAEEQANALAAVTVKALRDGGVLVLPGGSSPRLLISKLAQSALDWSRITITTTDERCVAISDAENNVGQIQRLFAAQGVDVSPLCLWDDEADAVTDTALPLPSSVCVLGMGPDGHIASLFPENAYDPDETSLTQITASKPPPQRITMSMAMLAQTERLILMVNGAEKMQLCEEIAAGKHTDLPLARFAAYAKGALEAHCVS